MHKNYIESVDLFIFNYIHLFLLIQVTSSKQRIFFLTTNPSAKKLNIALYANSGPACNHSPLSRRNLFIFLFVYHLFWTQACPEGMCTNGTQVPCEVPSLPNPTTRKGWPHHRGLRPLLFSNSDVGSFTSHKNK